MSVRVAVLVSPAARIDLAHTEFEVFVHLVRAFGAAVEPVPHVAPDVLRGCGALWLCDPTEELSAESSAAVATWVSEGGRLLLTNGDAARHFVNLLPAPLAEGLSLRRREVPDDLLPLAPLAEGSVHAPSVTTWCVPEVLRDRVRGLRPWATTRFAHGWSRGWLARLLGRDREYALAEVELGKGRLTYVGAREVFHGPHSFLATIAARWIGFAERDLTRRMGRVQRHRLLHGYPMAPLMTTDVADFEVRSTEARVASRGRRAIVGVLPHPFCNPAVKGCGFCTFPHEDYNRPLAHDLALAVAKEIKHFAPGLPVAVEAVYLGGATANLTPPDDLAKLCRALATRFALRGAEVTLEGVPIYFLAKKPRPLDVLRKALPDCALRVSMGVQTFDREWLERMGRSAFGDAATFAEVVSAARELKAGVSLDLLCNLPGQPSQAMHDDVTRAIDLGVDQVCLYHLVLDEGMDTTWAHDASLLARRPDNAAACANWIALRERLLAAGYVQRTLTNFERAEAAQEGRAFRYEELGFTPEEVDVLGFGPGGLSLRVREGMGAGIKTMNVGGAAEYRARAPKGKRIERSLVLGRMDMKILWLTRRVALLGLERAAYTRLFYADVLDEFGDEIEACVSRGLCEVTAERVALTPEGMFYADSVAGLFAARRVEEMKLKRRLRQEREPYANSWRHSYDDAQDDELRAALSDDPNDARDFGMG
jgi:oxygen-independent coproporphyrinogen-3 oxidase